MINSFEGQYRFLSNFFHSLITYRGITYPTVEHAYQAAKSQSKKIRRAIAEASTAREAKLLGRTVVLRPDWEKVKFAVMEELLLLKFSDKQLAALLAETGSEELIEGNWWGDRIWGVCNGVGQNHLGKLLMKTRLRLVNCKEVGDGS